MRRTFGGLSSETGFMIYDNFGVKVKTSGYKELSKKRPAKWKWFIVTRAMALIPQKLKEINSRIELVKFKEKDSKTWQDMAEYHACEHKLISLLE